MRRQEFTMSRDRALVFLRNSTLFHLATTTPDGLPVLRTVHGVVLRNHLYFHSSRQGEQATCIGQKAVLQCETIAATTPSYFVDAQRACPATTHYQSVQVSGQLSSVDDLELKAEVLATLLDKLQPEGGYVPISPTSRLYRPALLSLSIVGVCLHNVVGKSKLAQNRTVDERVNLAEGLWARGAPGDLVALELVVRENADPSPPPCLRAPAKTRLCVASDRKDAEQVAELLRGQYWTLETPAEELVAAHLGSAAWVVARDTRGNVVGSARAISDSARHAYIADVIVAPTHRCLALGTAVVQALLAHPALRRTTRIALNTTGAEEFYKKFGFALSNDAITGPNRMVLLR